MTAGSLLALLTPLVLKWLIDQVLPQRETGLLFLAAFLIFLSYQGRTALTSLGNYLTLTAAQKIALRLRMDIMRHLDKLSADYYESTPPGGVMYPLKEPIEEVAYFGSDLLPAILRLCLTTSFTVVTMFVLSPPLTLARESSQSPVSFLDSSHVIYRSCWRHAQSGMAGSPERWSGNSCQTHKRMTSGRKAALALAELQIDSIHHGIQILAAGARDLSVNRLSKGGPVHSNHDAVDGAADEDPARAS